MPIAFKCSCGKAYKVPDEAAGKSMKCKECGESLQVPKQAVKKKSQQVTADPNDIFSMDLGLDDDPVPTGLPPRRKKSSEGGKKKKGKKSAAVEKSNTGLYIGIGVLVAVVVGVGGFFAYQSMNGSGDGSGGGGPKPLVVEYDQFKHELGGFSVKQPKGWETKTGGGTGGLPPFLTFDDGTANISIKHNSKGASVSDIASIPGGGQIVPGAEVEEELPAKSIHKFMGETVYSLNYKNYEESPGNEFKVPFGTGWLSEFTGKEGFSGTQKAYRLTLPGGQFQYNVICICPEKKWEHYEPVFMEVIKSISR